jgi:hypothetical protein
VTKLDCWYQLPDERLIAFSRVPEIERLRWLDELVTFTLMMRAAPTVSGGTQPAEPGAAARPGGSRLG